MKKGRHTTEQIIGVLKEHEAGRKVQELAREVGVSEATVPSETEGPHTKALRARAKSPSPTQELS